MVTSVANVWLVKKAQQQRSPSSGSEGPNTSSQELAWRREMERAQLGDWFNAAPQRLPREQQQPRVPRAEPVADERGAAMKIVGVPAVELRLGGASPPLYLSNLAGGKGTTFTEHSPAPRPSSITTPADEVMDPRPSSGMPVPEAPLSPPRRMAGNRSAQSTPIDPQSRPDLERSPMSVHTEVAGEGVAVWLGMQEGGAALETMLPGVVADLQRGLQDRGQRLYQVVCNGRLVWRDGRSIGDFSTIYSKEP